MKITKAQLVQIIKEEAANFKKELSLKNELAEIERQLNEVHTTGKLSVKTPTAGHQHDVVKDKVTSTAGVSATIKEDDEMDQMEELMAAIKTIAKACGLSGTIELEDETEMGDDEGEEEVETDVIEPGDEEEDEEGEEEETEDEDETEEESFTLAKEESVEEEALEEEMEEETMEESLEETAEENAEESKKENQEETKKEAEESTNEENESKTLNESIEKKRMMQLAGIK